MGNLTDLINTNSADLLTSFCAATKVGGISATI